jgi:hypothetical protein
MAKYSAPYQHNILWSQAPLHQYLAYPKSSEFPNGIAPSPA